MQIKSDKKRFREHTAKMSTKDAGNVEFASVLYSEPSALGLFTNVLSAFIVAMLNFFHGSYSGYEAQILAGKRNSFYPLSIISVQISEGRNCSCSVLALNSSHA